MSEQDVQDAAATIARIGDACDALQDLGFPELAPAIAEATRRRRGRIKAHVFPARLAADLMALADEAEAIVARLRTPPLIVGIDSGRPCPPCTTPEDCGVVDECALSAEREATVDLDDMRVLTGGDTSEAVARVSAVGRAVKSVTHDVAPAGESVLVEFMAGGNARIPAGILLSAPRDRPGVLVSTWLTGATLEHARADA